MTVLPTARFDLRMYLLVASTKPLVLYWREGYARKAMQPYDPAVLFSAETAGMHITNTHKQKLLPEYKPNKHIWSMKWLRENIANTHGQAKLGEFSRRRDCHFAAPPSTFSRRVNSDVERALSKLQSRRRLGEFDSNLKTFVPWAAKLAVLATLDDADQTSAKPGQWRVSRGSQLQSLWIIPTAAVS